MNDTTMLMVDDEPHLALIVGRVARKAGIAYSHCADAPTALAYLSNHSAELVLLDVNLPGMSGLELLRRLREDDLHVQQKVALFSQSGQGGDVAAGWSAGADYLVPKDLIAQPDALSKRLLAILAHARGQGGNRLLTCPWKLEGQTQQDWATHLERILTSERASRELGGEVLEQVLRRAVLQAWPDGLAVSWVLRGQARFTSLPRTVDRQSVWSCFASLAEQLWCLLGPDASVPLADSLQAALDRVISIDPSVQRQTQ